MSIEEFNNILTPREIHVLKLRLDKYTLREAGEILNVSGERVREIQRGALRKLRMQGIKLEIPVGKTKKGKQAPEQDRIKLLMKSIQSGLEKILEVEKPAFTLVVHEPKVTICSKNDLMESVRALADSLNIVYDFEKGEIREEAIVN